MLKTRDAIFNYLIGSVPGDIITPAGNSDTFVKLQNGVDGKYLPLNGNGIAWKDASAEDIEERDKEF